ncbi:MAG TPA: hypothetical protein VMG37_06290 [Solirubrobacteraceae bacterium]|nr:hypothetical protein [Solirubrobacteraceae bacterium]
MAGVLAVGALVFHSVPADAAPLGPTTLAGLSSQGFPSFFEISNNGRTLKLGAIALGMTCASGDEFVFTDRDVRVPITRSGKLHADFAQAPTPASGGGTVGGTDSLNATLNPQRTELTGTWRVQQTYISSTGQTDQCDSGPVRLIDSR